MKRVLTMIGVLPFPPVISYSDFPRTTDLWRSVDSPRITGPVLPSVTRWECR